VGGALWLSSARHLILECPVDPERGVAAGIVFEIVPGKPAGQRDFDRAEIDADKTAATDAKGIYANADKSGVWRSDSRIAIGGHKAGTAEQALRYWVNTSMR
jgi:hypothetical protein